MLKNNLYRKFTGLHDFIEELEGHDYFNTATIKALKSFRVTIAYFKDNFDKIDEIHYANLYRTINDSIIPEIRLVQRAKTRDIPWSLISNLDEVLKNEFGDMYFLVFRPQWHFNYSVRTEDINSYLKKILGTFYPEDEEKIENNLFSEEKIHTFSFPYLEKNNVLLNSVIGHEIGHFYHKKWENDFYCGKDKLEEKHNKILSAHYYELYKNELTEPLDLTEEGLKILKGLYREIIPDIYGYYLFGPSIIFSMFFDISIFETKQILPSEATDYYPMTKYRIRLLVDHILKNDTQLRQNLSGDCSKVFEGMLKEISEYLQNKDDLTEWLTQRRDKERNLFESSLNDIIPAVKNAIKHEYLKYENITELYSLLENNLPINELNGKPVDIMEIIFTGWIYYAKLDKGFLKDEQKDEFVDGYKILMRLLLKSLYSSYIHKKYLDKEKTHGYFIEKRNTREIR